MTSLEELAKKAQEAEEQIRKLTSRVNELQNRLKNDEEKSELVMGLPSTMGDNNQLNLRKLMERAAIMQPNSEVVTKTLKGYHTITYKDLQAKATKLAIALHNFGIKPGDRVATFMWNNHRHLCLYYAVPSMGAVLHTINIRLHPNELKYIINHAEDKILFVDCTVLPLLLKVDRDDCLLKVKKIIVCGLNEETGNWKCDLENTMDFDEFLKLGDNNNNNFTWPNLNEKSACALCYTSGTTGNPKGVLYSHRSTYLHTLQSVSTDCMGISGKDCLLPYVPMFHALSWCTPFSAFMLGYKFVCWNHFRGPQDILQMCIDQNVTFVAGVPSVLNGIMVLLQNDTEGKYNTIKGQISSMICGGTAPPRSMIEFYWNNYNIEIIHGWGMTETNPVGSVGHRICRRQDLKKNDNELLQNQCYQGLITPCIEAKIVNRDNNNEELLWDGEKMGELIIRGPWVTTCYYKVSTPDKFLNGWLKTGDIASFTKDSQLFLRDRSKDLIKSSGEWISSADLENYCMAMKQIKLCCCVGVYHPKHDERPIIIAVLNENQTLNLEQLREHVLKKYSSFQKPDDLLIWKEEDLPLGGTGKINKVKVRETLKKINYKHPDVRETKE